ncbi:double strand break repair nuclease mre11 isoform X1 [Nomia melanderi]|uniref:double strand break repair nuclease mre11 isoform X1 n=2 Tax=Nomia melanderi TaxID=2448451 RepID=UPI001304078D|nr:double-strand break repair protein MRE11 isoform X1 [Nomia melanderi]
MSSEQGCSESLNPNDTFKILVATDIHLGFDHNKRRGQETADSFITFEEILHLGKENEVDFILLGGDLFHDTKPSQTAILKCMELLRKYCLGPREIKVEFLTDPEVAFKHCAHKIVNYEDPNLNISMPIFSIHGNHDDPSFGAVGSMDLLSASGFVNYFGKWTSLSKITIPPLILKKGENYIALYGLSYINDQRLSRLLRDYKVDMLRPNDIPECFNILVLHQNRAQHNEYGHIPQNQLPNFLNLIIWGHEHECRITPEFINETEYFISQPGSSIATSLSEGEAKPKHIGLLSINGMKFKMKKLRLGTVRPFVFDNLILSDEDIQKDYNMSLSESVYNFVDNHIENVLIPKAAEQLSGHIMQPVQPLLRLRIFHTKDEEVFDTNKLGLKYCEEVANPMEMIVFRKDKNIHKKSKSSFSNIDDNINDMVEVFGCIDENADWNKSVQEGLKKHFSLEENKDLLTVLTVNGLNEALSRFVDKHDTDAFKEIVRHQMKKTIAHLETCEVDTNESIANEIKNYRDKRIENDQEDIEIQQLLNNKTTKKTSDSDQSKDIETLDSSGNEETDNVPTTKGRGRGKGTVGRGKGSRGGTRGKGKESAKSALDMAITKRSSKTTVQTKKQDQTTLQSYMSTSNKNKIPPHKVFVIDDSD